VAGDGGLSSMYTGSHGAIGEVSVVGTDRQAGGHAQKSRILIVLGPWPAADGLH